MTLLDLEREYLTTEQQLELAKIKRRKQKEFWTDMGLDCIA